MSPPKTLREREQELQARILTPGGPAELEKLAERYAAAGGGPRGGVSVITYILVHERVSGSLRP